jgi:hypothetical protein
MAETAVELPPSTVAEEISRREILANVLNSIIHPQETREDLQNLSRLLAGCTKFYLDTSGTIHGMNGNGTMFQLKQKTVRTGCCCCDCYDTSECRISFLHENVPAFEFSYVDPPICNDMTENQVNVTVPGLEEPVGKLKYSVENFIEKPVKMTNILTGEIFTGRYSVLTGSATFPRMHIKNSTGAIVAVCGVTSTAVSRRRGTRVYKAVEINFPEIGLAATTKTLMLAYGITFFMDQFQKSRLRICFGAIFSAIILALIVAIFVFVKP